MNVMTIDTLRRFIMERAHVRGEWVHLDETWQEMLKRSAYPLFVKNILGEALTAAVLLSSIIKHEGSLILQIRGDGPIHLLVIQATAEGTLRGLAQWNCETQGKTLTELFGQGHLAITLENKASGERYQSILPLIGDSLTQALEHYFAQSEQLPTRLWLTSTDKVAAGILLQRLPHSAATDEDWQRATTLLETLTAQELAYLEAEEVLYRLFHDEDTRLLAAKPIRFHCGCSRARVENMLRSLGQIEVETLLQEQGKVEVVCEFCNATYLLDTIDVNQLFTAVAPSSSALH